MFRGAFSALLVLGYVGLVSLDQGRASDPALPDRALTPGAVATTDLALICKPGYARAVRHTALAVKHAFGCSGISTRQHNEPDGNQDVWHYHVHVFPRYPNDGLYGSTGTRVTGDEVHRAAELLRSSWP